MTSVKAARARAKRIAGSPPATLLGTGEKSSALGAALVNSTMVRDLDLNDTYFSRNPAHNSDNLGVCLAVGEAEGAAGADVIKSILVAFHRRSWMPAYTPASMLNLCRKPVPGIQPSGCNRGVFSSVGQHHRGCVRCSAKRSPWKRV